MVTIASPQNLSLHNKLQLQKMLSQDGVAVQKGNEKSALLESKLKNLDVNTLSQLQSTFFETAQNALPTTRSGLPPTFHSMSPLQFLASSMADQGFALPSSTASSQESPDISPEPTRFAGQATTRPHPGSRATFTHSKTPGIFSSKSADEAAKVAKQAQTQTQNFLANQLGQSFAQGNMAEFLGPNACFEDVLATVMMNIAAKSEKEMMEQIRVVERGESGLNSFMANGARDLGGIAGGALGGYFGGPAGAAIGQDVGERLVGNYTGQYGGSSRQVQFERLKMMINKQSEMMTAISNILATIHSTNKNTISNIRG